MKKRAAFGFRASKRERERKESSQEPLPKFSKDTKVHLSEEEKKFKNHRVRR